MIFPKQKLQLKACSPVRTIPQINDRALCGPKLSSAICLCLAKHYSEGVEIPFRVTLAVSGITWPRLKSPS